jgi:hypothetical protein
MRNKNAKCHVWRKPGTILTAKHGGRSITPWGFSSVAGIGRLVRIEAKMNGEKYRHLEKASSSGLVFFLSEYYSQCVDKTSVGGIYTAVTITKENSPGR